MDVDCIAFTGSTRVGKQIHVMAGQSNLKRAWTELGGKSPNIVFADCPNLDRAVEAAVGSIFFNQGESCNAPSRLYVQDSIKEKFLGKGVGAGARLCTRQPDLARHRDGCAGGHAADEHGAALHRKRQGRRRQAAGRWRAGAAVHRWLLCATHDL